MKLIMLGSLDTDVVTDLAGKCCVVLTTDDADDARALAPLMYRDVKVVDRDIKPENVWLVKDDAHLYLNRDPDDGSELWIYLQHNATRFADRQLARNLAKKHGARLIRVRTTDTSSDKQGGHDG